MKTLTAFLALFLMSLTTSHAADSDTIGDITVSEAWSRASTGVKRPGGSFVTITNTGSAADRLVAAETPAAARTELHNHIMEDGMMKMRQVMGIDVPGGGVTMLKPGSFHVMMFDLTNLLKEGDMFPLTLTFEKAGKATVMVHVGKAGGMMSHDHSAKHMESMDHSKHMTDEEKKKMHEEHMKDDEHKKMHDAHMKTMKKNTE
ncbi:MAG: copper chaperone PCu(A)C [Rhodospirillaceae bacterium]|nr:copper chaperone PCu(A)C [Rhodospirillaceae bacterium]MBL6931404.1 copper chaperone PCu(A)C [Rhodospirillales bacterium]